MNLIPLTMISLHPHCTLNSLEGLLDAVCSLLINNSFFGLVIRNFVSSVLNVHAFVSVHQPGNDVSQRINRARHFMTAASSCLNRTEVIHPL